MNQNLISCDLCSASAPHERAREQDFSSVTIQGQGYELLKPHLGSQPSFDLCSHCMASLTAWVVAGKSARTKPAAPLLETPSRTEP